MLTPKKVKFRKWQTGRRHIVRRTPETRGTTVAFGSYGLKAITQCRVSAQQIEAGRKALTHFAGKTGKVWVRIFPDRPFTQKPAEVKMGKGKGDVQGYEFDVRPGRVLYEVDGVTEAVAREALRKAGTKMPVKSKIVARNG
jgi:large subunit ribosomal protein L16